MTEELKGQHLLGTILSPFSGTIGVLFLDFITNIFNSNTENGIGGIENTLTVWYFLLVLFLGLLFQILVISPILKFENQKGRLTKQFLIKMAIFIILILTVVLIVPLTVPEFGLFDFLKTCLVSLSLWVFYFVPNFITYYFLAMKD